MIKKGLIISLIILLIMTALILWSTNWMGNLEQIPLHWNADGNVDRYGTPKEALLLLWGLVGVAGGITLTLSVLPLILPKKENLERSAHVYLIAWIGTLLLLLVVMGLIIFTMYQSVQSGSESIGDGVPRLILGGTGLFFALVGNYLPKTRSNWIIGIRTPWSLSNEIAWEKTQRFGGYGLMIGGVVICVSAFFAPLKWLVGITFIASLIPTLGAIIYSYLVWRKESGNA